MPQPRRLNRNRVALLIGLCLVFLFAVSGCIYLLLFSVPKSQTLTPAQEAAMLKLQPPGDAQSPREVVEALGSATWTLLHILAENYPKEPSVLHKRRFLSLLHSLEALYPHEESRETWKLLQSISALPEINVALESRENLKAWLCGFHNDVNNWLSKPSRSCESALLSQHFSLGPLLPSDNSNNPSDVFALQDPSRSVLHELVETAAGPCDLPASHALFVVQQDPIPEGFSFPRRRFGPAPVTVLLFATTDCTRCVSLLTRLSHLRQSYSANFNTVAVFEWNVRTPPRDDRLVVLSQIEDDIRNIPVLYESFSGPGSWYHHVLDFYGGTGVPYAVVYKHCEIQKVFAANDIALMEPFLRELAGLPPIPTLSPQGV